MTNSKKVFRSLKAGSGFELVYEKGKVLISQDKKLKVKYILNSEDKEHNIKIGLSISSKKGNSVWRNRIRRIIKEALQTSEDLLKDISQQVNTGLWMVFSPHIIDQTNNKKIFLKDIQPPIRDLLVRLKNKSSPTR